MQSPKYTIFIVFFEDSLINTKTHLFPSECEDTNKKALNSQSKTNQVNPKTHLFPSGRNDTSTKALKSSSQSNIGVVTGCSVRAETFGHRQLQQHWKFQGLFARNCDVALGWIVGNAILHVNLEGPGLSSRSGLGC